jgi:hypothetical protein
VNVRERTHDCPYPVPEAVRRYGTAARGALNTEDGVSVPPLGAFIPQHSNLIRVDRQGIRARSDGDQQGAAGTHGHSTDIDPGPRFPWSDAVIMKDSQLTARVRFPSPAPLSYCGRTVSRVCVKDVAPPL